MNELLKKMQAFYKERDWEQFHSPKNLAINLSLEVAEILEHFLWMTEDKSYELESNAFAEVRDEIGDAFICLLNLAHKLGIDPLEAAHQKLIKIGKRYPVDKCKGKSLKYTAYQAPPYQGHLNEQTNFNE